MESITTREPEFDARQRSLLLAHMALEGDLNSLGIPRSVAVDPKNQFKFKGKKAPTVDWSEVAVAEQQEKFYKAHPGVSRAGHHWGLKEIPE